MNYRSSILEARRNVPVYYEPGNPYHCVIEPNHLYSRMGVVVICLLMLLGFLLPFSEVYSIWFSKQ